MHFVNGQYNGNAAEAVRVYRRTYPNRPVPSRQLFEDIHLRLAERGIQELPNKRNRLVSPEEEEEVLRSITRDPRLSVRRIALQLELSKWTVWRILKREGLHPFHFRRVQDLREPDYAIRADFDLLLVD